MNINSASSPDHIVIVYQIIPSPIRGPTCIVAINLRNRNRNNVIVYIMKYHIIYSHQMLYLCTSNEVWLIGLGMSKIALLLLFILANKAYILLFITMYSFRIMSTDFEKVVLYTYLLRYFYYLCIKPYCIP